MQETSETRSAIDPGTAVDLALRESGGGRVAGVRSSVEFGRPAWLVQFVRGSWLCTAAVDAGTGEVTMILDDGPRADVAEPPLMDTAATDVTVLRSGFVTIGDLRAGSGTSAYAATEHGIAHIRLTRDGRLVVEDHHRVGPTREVAPVPGGVVATTADGRLVRVDPDGRPVWELQLPSCPHSLATDDTGTRLLAATMIGALEVDATTGAVIRILGGAVRAAAYLPDGGRVLAGQGGKLLVLDAHGEQRWTWTQGERPGRMWVRDGRIHVTGEGGLKEILPGVGVLARWSSPLAGGVRSAVVTEGVVFTCSGEARLEAHGYATAGYAGPLDGVPDHPETMTLLTDPSGAAWLLTAHRGGLISAVRT
ncbi:hypothetical protein [Paractinoplanes lichenicola]|uniref:Uncharacterized protein n=1 Tax=Paractinoplanes lichenicola TaxID=2802976 RepID=A0ABS1VWL0_9ACTN|nr:hypothetical protein [Actinoplanes lichenicola]MBL7258876.1 hypothetical protein [Actinoplanes lichenicola]